MASLATVEFLGTSLLISAVAFGSPILVVAALGIAISFGSKVSGAHYNPAITLFHYMNGRVSRNRALIYVVAQLAAGATVAFLRSII